MRVLISNDDGPPSSHSPFILPFISALRDSVSSDLNFEASQPLEIKVIVPETQYSWGGAGFAATRPVSISYLYTPRSKDYDPKPVTGVIEKQRRKEEEREGLEEFVLADGSSSSCVSLGEWNVREIWTETRMSTEEELEKKPWADLVITGPNFGRNTGTAFGVSSATLGSALSANLAGVPSIALSYGLFNRPVLPSFIAAANQIATRIIWKLWRTGFPENDKVRCYSVNVPLIDEIISRPKVVWATVEETRYSKMFKKKGQERTIDAEGDTEALEGGTPKDERLTFAFQPDIGNLIHPPKDSLVEGTDTYSMFEGEVTVTCFRAAYQELKIEEEREWKL